MRPPKVKDLLDVRNRDFPLLLYVDRDPGEQVLHICRRIGDNPNMKAVETITECNRVLQYASAYSGTITGTISSFFRLCHTCGTQEEFEAALKEYKQGHAELGRKYKEKQDAEAKASRIAWQEQKQAVAEFAGILREFGITIYYDDELGKAVATRHDYRFDITGRKG